MTINRVGPALSRVPGRECTEWSCAKGGVVEEQATPQGTLVGGHSLGLLGSPAACPVAPGTVGGADNHV